MKLEDRKKRLTEVRDRMQAIHTEHSDSDLPDDLAAEWQTLATEMTEHDRAITDGDERARMVAAFTASAGQQAGAGETVSNANAGYEGGNGGEGANGGDAGSRSAEHVSRFAAAFIPTQNRDQLFDIDAVRSRVHSYEELPAAYRNQAYRALEATTRFPNLSHTRTDGTFGPLTTEYAQDTVARLLATIDDDLGRLAQRVLLTGSDLYDRAFGKLMERGVMAALDPAEQQAVSRALALGVDAQGGFAVPFQLDPTVILTSNGAINPLRQIARIETITGKEWDGVTSAGVTVTRVSEGTEAGTGDAAFVQPTVRTNRVQGFVPFNIELDVSWAALRTQMTALLMDAKDIEEASAFITGNGTAPQAGGLIATLLAASVVFTAGTATLAIGDLYNLENQMPPRFRQQSAYLASRTTYNRFRQLFQALASAAFDSWVRPSAGQPATFNGYPAYEQSIMDGTITSNSNVLLQGDFKKYLIVDRVGMGIELIPHLFGPTNRFPTGQRGILAIWFNNAVNLVQNAFRLLRCL